MERITIVDDCYQTWWELQCQVNNFYSGKERRRPPLSEQKEFRAIKNAVVQEAENIRMDAVTFEDEDAEKIDDLETADLYDVPYECRELWMVNQDDTAFMEERDEAAAQLIDMVENGDPQAQYLTGKLFLDGPVMIPDSVVSGYWFEQSARQGHIAAQYELGKLLLSDDPEVRNPTQGMQWLEYAAYHGNDNAAYRLGKEYLAGKIVEKGEAKAMDYLTQASEAGNQYAQYALGKLYLSGRVEMEKAYYWFSASAAQGNPYAQFFLDRWESLNAPTVMLSATRLLHHMGRIFQEQAPSTTVPGGIQIDRKRLEKVREKKIAMGHKPDDREEPSWGAMTMG